MDLAFIISVSQFALYLRLSGYDALFVAFVLVYSRLI